MIAGIKVTKVNKYIVNLCLHYFLLFCSCGKKNDPAMCFSSSWFSMFGYTVHLSIESTFLFGHKPLPSCDLQVHWRWSSPPSLFPRTLVTLPCCAARSLVSQHPSSAGRRTGKISQWPLTPTPVWQCCHPARCRSAVSSHQTQPHIAVWLTTPAALGRGQMRNSECSQVTNQKMTQTWL